MTFQQQHWDSLSRNSRIRLWRNGDPRVPEDYEPDYKMKNRTNGRPKSVVVTLSPFLLEMSEAELWDYLLTMWYEAKIEPQSVTFRAPNGASIITIPISEDKYVRRIARTNPNSEAGRSQPRPRRFGRATSEAQPRPDHEDSGSGFEPGEE